MRQIDTDAGPVWIGAQGIWDGTATGDESKGEGLIIGMIDTGINGDHPSFADIGGDGYNHTNPFGAGNYLGWCDARHLHLQRQADRRVRHDDGQRPRRHQRARQPHHQHGGG